MNPDKSGFCCCGISTVRVGVYIISVQAMIQGVYAVTLVFFSYYKDATVSVNNAAAIANMFYIPTGLFTFWAVLYENWKGIKVSAVFLCMVTIISYISIMVYFGAYVNFQANSLLDNILFWTKSDPWIGDDDFPFSIWHILCLSLLLSYPIWWYFSFILWQYGSFIKYKKKTSADLAV